MMRASTAAVTGRRFLLNKRPTRTLNARHRCGESTPRPCCCDDHFHALPDSSVMAKTASSNGSRPNHSYDHVPGSSSASSSINWNVSEPDSTGWTLDEPAPGVKGPVL